MIKKRIKVSERNAMGRPAIYSVKTKVVSRSVPVDLIPLLDQWLKDQKAKYMKVASTNDML